MKKYLLAAAGTVLALAATAVTPRATIEEAKTAIESGKAIKSELHMRSMTRNLIKASSDRPWTEPLTVRAAKAPSKITAGGSNIYAYLSYTTSEDTPIGLYTLDAQGYSLQWADPAYESDGLVLSSGWLADGKVCGFAPVEFFGYIISLYYLEYDLETGTVITDRDADMSKGTFSTATYNPEDKCIYGFGNTSSNGMSFLKADAATPDNFECVQSFSSTPEKICTAITYNNSDNKLYGITTGGSLVSLATDGTETEVMQLTGVEVSDYISGLVYSPIENVFFWNLITNSSSDLYRIDPTEKTVELTESFGTTATFPILFTTDEKIDPEAPAMPEISKINFEGGALSGSIVYRLPSLTAGGNAIEGNLDWTCMLDNAEYKTGAAAAGSEVTVDFDGVTEGSHNISFYANSGTKTSRKNILSKYIGFDTPKRPANVKLTETEVTWSAVTEGINNGYIDVADIEYEVFINSASIGKTKNTSIEAKYPDAVISAYEAEVVAINRNKNSEPGKSNTIIFGKPFTPDVTFEPTEEEAKLFTIVDVGQDDNTWYFDPMMYDTSGFVSGNDDNHPMNDWLFLPPVALQNPDLYYIFSMNARRRGNYYEEDFFEVCIGTSPDPAAMTKVIIPSTLPGYSFDWEKWDEYTQYFSIPEAGTYYIGIHCTSAEKQYGIVVRNISITDQGLSAQSPAAASNITAKEAENGVLQATVSFTLPTKTINDTDIASDAVISAKVSGENTVTVSGKPGETVSATVATLQGNNTITVTTEIGENSGLSATVDVFTGVHIPAVVKNVAGTISDDMRSVALSWEAPDAGEDGGYIDPTQIGYWIYTYDETWGWQKYTDLGIGVKTYTYTVPEDTEQDLFRIGIQTYNVAGGCSRVNGTTAILGKPYALPMSETFEGSSYDPFQINPWTYYTPTEEYNSQIWSVDKLANVSDKWSDLTTGALVGTSRNETGKGKMGIPRFTATGASDMEIELLAWCGENAATISITGIAAGMDSEVSVGTVLPGNGWKKSFIALPEVFNGKSWVQLYIEPEYKTKKDMCVIESLEVTGNTSGIGNIATATGIVVGAKGHISVSGFETGDISIYTIDGKTIASGTATVHEQTFAAAPGLYIVKVGNRSFKVIVR